MPPAGLRGYYHVLPVILSDNHLPVSTFNEILPRAKPSALRTRRLNHTNISCDSGIFSQRFSQDWKNHAITAYVTVMKYSVEFSGYAAVAPGAKLPD